MSQSRLCCAGKQAFAHNQFHLILCGQLALWSANPLYVCLFSFLYYLGDHVFTTARQWDRYILVCWSNGPMTRIYRILPLQPFKCNGITTVDKTQAACGWIEGPHVYTTCLQTLFMITLWWLACNDEHTIRTVLHLCSGLHCIWRWFVCGSRRPQPNLTPCRVSSFSLFCSWSNYWNFEPGV